MLKKTIKMGAFYNFVNNFVILVGTILIFAHINILSIFTICMLINTVIVISCNFSEFKSILRDNLVMVLLFIAYPLVFLIIANIHGTMSFFFFRIVFVLMTIPFVLLCVRYFYYVSIRLLTIAYIISGVLLSLRMCFYFLLSDANRFDHFTSYNSIHTAAIVAIYALVSIYVSMELFKVKKNKLATIFLVLGFLTTVALFTIASRGPLLAFSAIFFMLILYDLNVKKILSTIIAFIGVGLLAYSMSSNTLVSKFDMGRYSETLNIEQQYAKNKDTSIGLRIMMYKVGINAFLHNPLIGANPTTINSIENKMIEKNEVTRMVKSFTHFHSDIFNVLGRYGIVGLISLFVFWFMLFRFYKVGLPNNYRYSKHINMILLIVFGEFILASFSDSYISGGSMNPALMLMLINCILYSVDSKFLKNKYE
ncbi:O-antigen ligase family protein [Francisellaceae bacterium CB299]